MKNQESKQENRWIRAIREVKDKSIMNLIHQRKEYYSPMKKVYQLFFRSFCLLFLFGVISNAELINYQWYLRFQNYAVVFLIILMIVSVFSMKNIRNKIEKQIRKEEENVR